MTEALMLVEDGLSPSKKPKKSDVTIESTYTEELVFALCGPIGSPIHKVADIFKQILDNTYGYDCEIIRLSKFIEEEIKKDNKGDFKFANYYERLSRLIEYGDKIRQKHNRPSFLAELAIEKIAESRINQLSPEERKKIEDNKGEAINFKSRRKCFIIDSIKNQHELDVLKTVYRDLFYFIGVYSSKQNREEEFLRKGLKASEAQILIDKDSGDNNDSGTSKYGQTVRKTFPLADLFIRMDSNSDAQLNFKIERFLHLIFNTKVITPSKDEMAMYLASAAAGNSACLSRQVGACLTDVDGNIISVGWNDVPKAGGHLYVYSEQDKLGEKDHRCMNIDGGKCHNNVEKERLAEEIADNLIQQGLAKETDKKKIETLLLGTKLKNLIEFSRAIHAEMIALIAAGQNNGTKIKGGSLYCTTYPCHNCARHLIAAGIMKIIYIEPYPKSLAIQLHSDSITENEADSSKVRLLAFDGISPNKYLQFFSYKQDDRKKLFDKSLRTTTAPPKYEVTLQALYVLEGIIVRNLKEIK